MKSGTLRGYRTHDERKGFFSFSGESRNHYTLATLAVFLSPLLCKDDDLIMLLHARVLNTKCHLLILEEIARRMAQLSSNFFS